MDTPNQTDARRETKPAGRDDLLGAKVNAALKILEWSKDDIEPGIGGSPSQLHIALAEAFRDVFTIVSAAIGTGPSSADGSDHGETARQEGAIQ